MRKWPTRKESKTRRADTCLIPRECREDHLTGKVVVVIDVLRASTTVACALEAGCRDVVPVEDIGEALRLAESLGRDQSLLCGEREGIRISGFDLGNSPSEYIPETVGGKTLILSTTNGTKALVEASGGSEVLVGCFANLRAVGERLSRWDGELVFVCSGREGRFSLEDAVCAGAFLAQLRPGEYALSDGARVALGLYREHSRDLLGMLRSAEHGRYLLSLGLEPDLVVASGLDRFGVVPIFRQGRIVRG